MEPARNLLLVRGEQVLPTRQNMAVPFCRSPTSEPYPFLLFDCFLGWIAYIGAHFCLQTNAIQTLQSNYLMS